MTVQLPNLTRTILIDQFQIPTYPFCEALETIIVDNPRGGLCFEIDIQLLLPGFAVLLTGAFSLIVLRNVVVWVAAAARAAAGPGEWEAALSGIELSEDGEGAMDLHAFGAGGFADDSEESGVGGDYKLLA